MSARNAACIQWLEDLTDQDVPQVGGKNASLGEMLRTLEKKGVRVPGGFATTAEAYRLFLSETGLAEEIAGALDEMDGGEVGEVGKKIRERILDSPLPAALEESLRDAYRKLSQQSGVSEVDVAVRSSATAEDLPEASFAGQQESFLNVVGEEQLLDTVRRCYASLFTDRAIAYREEQGFDHMEVALSAGVQKMVRADKGAAGVLFTLDTDTGFPRVILINAAWGLGESVVQGTVNPDRYLVFKPLLDQDSLIPIVEKERGLKEEKVIYDEDAGGVTAVETQEGEREAFVLSEGEILQLARWGQAIEDHYGRPMDIEWGKDGETGELFILQARPETVQARKAAGALKTFSLLEEGEVRISGAAVGGRISQGKVAVLSSPDEIDRFEAGSVLVTERTDPDWGPILEGAAAVVTDHGGRTSHAAIVSRELGIPAVVGTEDGTRTLEDGEEVTISCAEGDEGKVYAGLLEFQEEEVDLSGLPEIRTRLLMNIANPSAAFRWWNLPVEGIGLARIEFIISDLVKAHPLALLDPGKVEDEKAEEEIRTLIRNHEDGKDYFVDILSRQVARVAASRHPDPVIVRLSDFKTNEYANLLGGAAFEPEEENPMLGFRGAARYHSERYREAFRMECAALVRARDVIGLKNVVPMIPFCRSVEEADRVLEIMADSGLIRGREGLKIYVMAEIPSNVVMARELAQRFDGFSIGSNDLTQLVLGVDRDSEELRDLFDETDPAVKRMISDLIRRAHEENTEVGICGQAPSDHPDFAAFLVREGIDTISLNPDSVVEVLKRIARVEDEGAGGEGDD